MKRFIAIIMLAFLCIGAQAQIVSSTSKLTIRHMDSYEYSGLELTANGVGFVGSGLWGGGTEFTLGYRFDQGLFLGGQIGFGAGETDGLLKGRNPEGVWIPLRAVARYYFSTGRFQPYAQINPGLFFLGGDGGEVVAFSLQLGPGLCYGLNDKWSLDASINYDFATAAKAEAPSMGSAIKLGITYHF